METPKHDNNDNASSPDKTLAEEFLKQKSKTRGRKRKRSSTSESSSDMEDILAGNALEVEKNLHASAIKNNLDDASVKKILKKVVTNDHVLALVKLKEEEEANIVTVNQYPKLTRAKVKELMKVSPRSAPWNLENLELTPIKHIPVKTRPEVEALIAQELPDDEDDDEYQPTQDDVPSDDDQTVESCSDVDSMPRTPATPQSFAASPKVVTDGPFKVPPELKTPVRRKLQIDEATIALRTRSKINLSATPIEHIESEFVPPDDIPVPVDDDLWNEFLLQCLDPASNTRLEDDDEADPEYNVAADPDAHEEDEEALENSIIKISKKELNDLVTELFSVMPEDCIASGNLPQANDHIPATHWEGKQEPLSDEDTSKSQAITESRLSFSIGKVEPEDVQNDEMGQVNDTTAETNVTVENNCEHGSQTNAGTPRLEIRVDEVIERMRPIQDPPPPPPPLLCRLVSTNVTQQHKIIIEQNIQLFPEQVLILQQQLRQHIQLATSNYLQLYVHPEHWGQAPTYKEFLESLHNIVESRSNSVVNVCNLKPAIELIASWEKSVAENTDENVEMIKFIQKESERNRRRAKGNRMHVGDFHETYMKVVANSSVFLYPYLLPAMPYRCDGIKKFSYYRSEDSLLALGMDQFWDYIENNRDIYKPTKVHPRQRWGLSQVVQLVCKHMLPWYSPRTLLAHIHFVRKHGDKNNAINKFFNNRVIDPVSHKLLPFNPELTLYEQPEHEMPRIWIRYLAKSSKRFRDYYYKRGSNIVGLPPVNGVTIDMGKLTEAPTKEPLPIEFTKVIKSYRADLKPVVPAPHIVDKVDIIINKQNQQINANIVTVSTNTLNSNNEICTESINEEEANNISEDNATELVKSNEENTHMDKENINDSSQNLISENSEVIKELTTDTPQAKNYTTAKKVAIANKVKDIDHCKCCIMLRRICKQRQTMITEYFRYNNSKMKLSCPCSEISHPKISNRLRLLTNLYKNQSKCMFNLLLKKSRIVMNELREGCNKDETEWLPKFSFDDIAFVISYQMRLYIRTGIARNNYLKRRIHTLLSKFDPDNDNPVLLAENVFEAFHVELVDMYQEFLGFLTAQQADMIDHFREYFVHNCMPDLLKKIEEQVRDKLRLNVILSQLRKVTVDNVSTACDTCCRLLSTMEGLPELARYTFSLFPHTKQRCKKDKNNFENKIVCSPLESRHVNETAQNVQPDNLEKSQMDNETDNSTNKCDQENVTIGKEQSKETTSPADQSQHAEENAQLDIDTSELTVTKTEIQYEICDESSTMSTMMMSDDETFKTETQDWTRDEDKLILEILKDILTPEEIKDKTIIEILAEKNVVALISESLLHKSEEDIQDRVIYLLQLLILNN